MLLLAMASCGGSDESNDSVAGSSVAKYQESEAPDNAVAEDKNTSVEVSTVERKLIKQGDIEFETNDLGKTRNTILSAIKKYNGYLASEKVNNYDSEKSISLEVRIPSDDFDKFLSESTKGIKDFDKKDIEVRDVTEEFLDVQARLKTKKELENRYTELLKMAHNVTEILEIEREIGTLRADIESIEGRLNYLKNQVGYSTLNIRFYQKLDSDIGFGADVIDAFANGWAGLVMFVIVIINLWPFIIIVSGIIITLVFYRRKRRAQ